MSSKIVSRSLSRQGLDNWDKIFKKPKKIKPLEDVTIVINHSNHIEVCEECHGLEGHHKLGCLDYNGPGDPSH